MRTLAALSDLICSEVNKPDATSQTYCKKRLRQRAQMIYDAALWRETLWYKTVTITQNSQYVTLPNYVDEIVAVRYNQIPILPSHSEFLFLTNPTIFEQSGTPITYSMLQPVATEGDPAGQTLSFVSSNASDTGVSVKIVGELNGVPKRETISLSGTTPVATSNSYTYVYQIGKPVTLGDITITNASAAAMGTMWTTDEDIRCSRIYLHPIPSTTTDTMLVLFKRKARQMIDDGDTEPLTHMTNALLAFGTADMLRRMKQYAKADAMIAEGTTLLQQMKEVHEYQRANVPQIVPAPLLVPAVNIRGSRYGRTMWKN